MTIRTIALASAALTLMALGALPASAMPTQNSTPDERAQTEQLNTDAANRAHSNNASNTAAHDNYNRQQNDYRNGMADHTAQQQAYDRNMERYNARWHRHHGEATDVGFDFGTIAIGYNDGYWDNGHRWHAWRNTSDAHMYQSRYRNNFHNWRHDRDGNDGWQHR